MFWAAALSFVNSFQFILTSAFSLTTLDRVLLPPGVKLFLSPPSLERFQCTFYQFRCLLLNTRLYTGLFLVTQRSWWRPPGPGLWLTCLLRCAPCSGSRSGTPLRSARPPYRWTVFVVGSTQFLAIFWGSVGGMCHARILQSHFWAISRAGVLQQGFSPQINQYLAGKLTRFNHCPFRL